MCIQNQQEAKNKRSNDQELNCMYQNGKQVNFLTEREKKVKQSRNDTKNILFIFYSQSAVVITIGM